MRNILSTDQFKKGEVEEILERSREMEEDCNKGKTKKLLQDKIIACMFFEPSTRTRLSFETAALKLGAEIISSENAGSSSSAYKGEDIEDTARILSSYANAIVLRHPTAGTAEKAAKFAAVPIINAGDGANQHPSQGLLDLYTIQKEQGRLENLKISFVGDLLNSRPLHSLVSLLGLYKNNKFYFISPKELALPRSYIDELRKKGINLEELNNFEEILADTDVLYITRVQKERFQNIEDYEKVKDSFIFKSENLKNFKQTGIIMHALPRVNEIEKEVDLDSRAAYFRQAQNGLYVRMALLLYCLGV